MNEKFYLLPEEKQQAIINAGYQVFSKNSYKKSPVSEIATIAGISKSLLFYYFRNKKDLYLFLWEKLAQTTIEAIEEYGCYEKKDLFEMMYSGMQAKIHIMKQYPAMGIFAVKAFYEKDTEVSDDIQKQYRKSCDLKAKEMLINLEPSQFKEGIDLKMMFRDMYLASEGYLWEMFRKEEIDIVKMERDFREMIEFWKKIYLRES